MLLISLLVSLSVWTTFSWPLPKYVSRGIPFSSLHRTAERTEVLIPGDHLQLLYHFWLITDMMTGRTPLFSNIYEFNTGSDKEHYRPDACFFPFPLPYAVGSWIGNQAFGYNLTGFLALWLSYLFAWLLTCRYCPSRTLAGVAALVSIFIPYRWHALMGGSPAGLAMMWIPAILLGTDMAIKESRISGGILAGASLLLASMSDQHIFFFGTLTIPVWCVIAFVARTDFKWRVMEEYLRIALALLPVPLFLGSAYWLSHRMVQRVAGTVAAVRDIPEVANFSPHWNELFSIDSRFSNQIFIGYCLPVLLLAGLIAAIVHTVRNSSQWRPAFLIALLIFSTTGIIFLSLGPFGPFDSVFFIAARKFIPPYRMIRQTTKVFCLVPTFLAVASAMSCWSLFTLYGRRWWKLAVPVVFAALVFANYREQVMTGVCLLQTEQGAYRKIAEDARSRGTEPRAVVIPLWPGDTAQSSLYLYYASLYRVRMLNGYSPIIGRNYTNDIYYPFEKINHGDVPDDRLDALQRMKIDYLLLHEDTFPEVVSPFPVTFTLRNLLNNPRLKLLDRCDQTWAFRILTEPEEHSPVGGDWKTSFAGWRREAEACLTTNTVAVADKSAGGGIYVEMTNAGSLIEPRIMRMSFVPQLRYMLRVRGSGTFTADILTDEQLIQSQSVPVQASEWTWVSIPVPEFDGYRGLRIRIGKPDGLLDVDYILLAAGDWEWNLPLGKSVTLPAPLFFHAGHIDIAKDSVFMQSGRRSGTMFYGPKLPLATGKYRIEFSFSTPASAGTDMGSMIVELCEDTRIGAVPVIAGKPAMFEINQTMNMPLNVIFSYSGKADIDVTKVVITRLE
jgi:hypothetical protein